MIDIVDMIGFVRKWFLDHPGRTDASEIEAALGENWDASLEYSTLEEALEELVDEGFLEHIEAKNTEFNQTWVYWQRPHGAERPQSEDAGEIQTIIRLDEVGAETVTRLLEESPGPNEAMQKLFSEGGPLFPNLSDGADPREHVSTDPGVRLHPPRAGANHELAEQAAEATRQVLAKKDKDEFAEWVKAHFADLEQRVEQSENRGAAEAARLDEKINRVHRLVLRGAR